jgi:hypothetical protein
MIQDSRTVELDSHPFVPDTVLPSQFYATSVKLSGEQRMLLAILTDAIDCLRGKQNWLVASRPSENRRIRAQLKAETWIRGADAPFTFSRVCEVLGIDTDYLREHLLA